MLPDNDLRMIAYMIHPGRMIDNRTHRFSPGRRGTALMFQSMRFPHLG